MALHDLDLTLPLVDKNGYATEHFKEWLRINKKDKIDKVSSGTEDNIATLSSDGGMSDSGKSLPSGDIVGTSDTQTLSNKTLTTPTVSDLTNMAHDHTSASGGGDYPWADMTQAAAQADAAAEESHAITDPGDAPATADALRDDLVANAIPDIESALDALGAEFNSKFNALIDKLQAANLMS